MRYYHERCFFFAFKVSVNVNHLYFLLFSDVDLSLDFGVYLFLGYSTKDEKLLKSVTGSGIMETIGDIQGLVSYHNINNNKVLSSHNA